MNVKEIKTWLTQYDDNDEARVYIEVDDCAVLADPNMGFLLRDEIFEYQDKLDDLDFDEKGTIDLFLLIEDILDTLENRLEINLDFIKEMDEIYQKVVNGDDSDFVEVELSEKSFFDYVNDFANAKKIGEFVQASKLLIVYVTNRISDVDVEIQDNKLYIKAKDNTSLSTSIISELLGIKATNIDDMYAFNDVWSIHLNKR